MYRLGVSEFAAAIGACPYTSRAELWRRKHGLKIRQPIEILEWGKKFEHHAVACAEAKTGMMFHCTGSEQQKIKRGRFTVMPDGILAVPGGLRGKTSLEVKVRAIAKDPHESVPVHYMCQVQGAMWVGDFDQVCFCSWTFRQCRIWSVPRSDEFIGEMLPLVTSYFWWLDTGVVPPRFKRGEKPKMPPVLTDLLYEGGA